ncbi:MAG: hypothetical protein K2J39_02175 [Ruminococcus sp.]|nr:hypothetical protein [Ruminococcus sp.]
MGAYAVPSNQPFIAKGELKTKRKPGRLEEMTALLANTHIEKNEKGEFVLMRGDKLVGVFKDEEEENAE